MPVAPAIDHVLRPLGVEHVAIGHSGSGRRAGRGGEVVVAPRHGCLQAARSREPERSPRVLGKEDGPPRKDSRSGIACLSTRAVPRILGRLGDLLVKVQEYPRIIAESAFKVKSGDPEPRQVPRRSPVARAPVRRPEAAPPARAPVRRTAGRRAPAARHGPRSGPCRRRCAGRPAPGSPDSRSRPPSARRRARACRSRPPGAPPHSCGVRPRSEPSQGEWTGLPIVSAGGRNRFRSGTLRSLPDPAALRVMSGPSWRPLRQASRPSPSAPRG